MLTDDETLSDERLAEIRAKLDRTPIIPFTTDKAERGVARVQMRDLRWAVYTLLDLLAEVERLRASEATLMEIARAVAEERHPWLPVGSTGNRCGFCRRWSEGGVYKDHAADCAWKQARNLITE